jgi:hypothetical protein
MTPLKTMLFLGAEDVFITEKVYIMKGGGVDYRNNCTRDVIHD